MITIVGMIYKSTQYLDFMMRGILNTGEDYLIIANDPYKTVIDKLKRDKTNHFLYRDNCPEDFYLNRVYRAWNAGGRIAKGDIIVFVNSDMAFDANWLPNLIKRLDRNTIPCSRLVESGKLLSGRHAISKNFGRTVSDFDEISFLEFTKTISVNETHSGGLYMPCAFYKEDFIKSGGYPEGNIYAGGIGQYRTKFLRSGDEYFFNSNPVMSKKKHVTVFDSIAYHIQEGEKDEN